MFIGTVTGYLTKDVELRNTDGRDKVGNIRIGVIENKKRDDRDQGFFIDIEVWGDQAENAAKYLRKGDKIAASGYIRQDSWEDRETGDARTKLVIKANTLEYPTKAESGRGDRDDEPRRGRDDDRGRGRGSEDRGRGRDRDDRPSRGRDDDERGRRLPEDDLPF